MKNLRIKFLIGDILKLCTYGFAGGEFILSFALWKFQCILCIFDRSVWKLMGVLRFYVYFRGRTIFHWCDLCRAPRIRGVNL